MSKRKLPPNMLYLYLICFVLALVIGVLSEKFAWSHSLEEPLHEWFMAQLIPNGSNKGKSCCSVSDQVYAEEDIREGSYWVRFRPKEWGLNKSTDWMRVPNEAILTGPNKAKVPVVWYGFNDGKVFIRCYAPGSGV